MRDNLVSAVFDTHGEADRAIAELRAAGVPDSAISVVGQRGVEGVDTNDNDGEGSIVRGILGGGALGAGLGVAALAIPGVGPLAAAGAIAASAVPTAMGIGAVAGATAGSLNEALNKRGVSEEDATYYNERIASGGVFVSVSGHEGAVSNDSVADILYRNGGHNSSRSRVAAL